MRAQFSGRRLQASILALIIIAYLAVSGLFALRTPPWQAPDEPAHYNYAAQVAQNGCCPTIQLGDWDSAYLDQLKGAAFAPGLLDNLDAVQYEDHQPPLYYSLQAIVHRLTDGSLSAMRLFSAFLGVGIILCVYGAGVRLLPDQPQIALGAAAFAAFLPQHVAILASVSNDSLAWLLIAMTLLGTIIYLQDGTIKPWQLGLLVGLGLLTKVSTLFLIGLVPLAILAKSWTQERRIPLVELAQFFAPALLIGGVWIIHNINIYGFPDVFGLRQHDRVVVGQPRTAEMIAQVGFGAYLSSALQTTFNSFWGQFGWMALPLPAWMYPVLLLLTIVCLSGLLIAARRLRRLSAADHLPVLTLIVAALLAFLAYIYYNTEFLQFQGRYLFTGILPFALGLAVGLDAWREILMPRLKLARWLPLIVFAVLALLDVYLIWRIIPPLLSPAASTEQGRLTVTSSEYDGSVYRLTAGSTVEIRWEDRTFGADIEQVELYFGGVSPNQQRDCPTTPVGKDDDPSDGVLVEWVVPPEACVALYAYAANADKSSLYSVSLPIAVTSS